MSNTITYHYKVEEGHEKYLYLNITNRCTNRCTFCIRNNPDGVGGGTDLWLEHEPSVKEIEDALRREDLDSFDEIVFCGYGEPAMRFDDMMEVCRWLKANYRSPKIRINTNGHANRITGRDVTPELKGLVDVISISLNTSTAREYEEICQSDYGEEGFYIMLDFAKKATAYVPEVVLSVVDLLPKEEIEACRKIAEQAGCSFRVREYAE